MDDWEIDKPLGHCYGTGKKIESGEEYFATLVETAEGLKRRDFCADYWRENKPEVFCYWKTTFTAPDQKKHIFVDNEMLMSFFDRLAEETEQDKINFRFVLTLILMRKRQLKYNSSEIRGDKEIWRLKVAGENKFAEVINPHLSEEQIDQLSTQLSQILQADL